MSVLYRLDANYETLTVPGTAELVPQVDLPVNFLTGEVVLRGRLAGKVSTPGTSEPSEPAENPRTARIRVAISPPTWAPKYAYKVGDVVTHDGFKQYVCAVAGISDGEGFLHQKRRLVAYWPMHEVTGVAYDHGDNETNLTDVAYGTSYVPGPRGVRWMVFDGSTGYASGLIGAMEADWSYSLWVTPDTLPAEGATSMLFTIGARVELYLTNPSGVPTLTAAWRDSGTTARTLAYIVTLSAKTSYHIAVTHLGNTTTMYIDGVAVATESRYDSYDEPGTDIYLGRDTTAVNYYDGKINEVRLYSRGLSAEEVLYLYRLPPGSTALNDSDTLGPTGRDSSISDGTVTWNYRRESPIVLDTQDMALVDAERINTPWLFEFDIQIRRSIGPGPVLGTVWYGVAVTTGRYTAGNLAGSLLLPAEGPFAVDIVPTDANVLHVFYTVDFPDGSMTCMIYVLEAI